MEDAVLEVKLPSVLAVVAGCLDEEDEELAFTQHLKSSVFAVIGAMDEPQKSGELGIDPFTWARFRPEAEEALFQLFARLYEQEVMFYQHGRANVLVLYRLIERLSVLVTLKDNIRADWKEVYEQAQEMFEVWVFPRKARLLSEANSARA